MDTQLQNSSEEDLLKDTWMTVTPTVKYYVFLKSITISLFHYDSYTELKKIWLI